MFAEALTIALDKFVPLDALGTATQRAVNSAYGALGGAGTTLKDFMHGTWLGHPLHPMITDVPVGSWTASLVLDLAGMSRGADLTLGLGLLGALGAAVSGATDYSVVYGSAKKIGAAHAALNIVATGLYTGSWFARRRGARPLGQLLAAAGYGIASASAYLGGDLVYDKHVGVDRSSGTDLPTDFVRVADESALAEGAMLRVMAGETPVMLAKTGGRIYALAARCSHAGGPLNEGEIVDGACVQCPWHGSVFALDDGRVVHGPATEPQPSLDVRTRSGAIEVRARSSRLEPV